MWKMGLWGARVKADMCGLNCWVCRPTRTGWKRAKAVQAARGRLPAPRLVAAEVAAVVSRCMPISEDLSQPGRQ